MSADNSKTLGAGGWQAGMLVVVSRRGVGRGGAMRGYPRVSAGSPGLAGGVEGGLDDSVGVDAVVAVDVVQGAGLAEGCYAEGHRRDLVDRREESQRVGVAVEDGDHRGGALGRKGGVQDPRGAG